MQVERNVLERDCHISETPNLAARLPSVCNCRRNSPSSTGNGTTAALQQCFLVTEWWWNTVQIAWSGRWWNWLCCHSWSGVYTFCRTFTIEWGWSPALQGCVPSDIHTRAANGGLWLFLRWWPPALVIFSHSSKESRFSHPALCRRKICCRAMLFLRCRWWMFHDCAFRYQFSSKTKRITPRTVMRRQVFPLILWQYNVVRYAARSTPIAIQFIRILL